MRSRRKVQNRMSVLKRTGKKNVLALALAIAMVSSTLAGEPLSIHAYADETNAISSSDDGSSKSSGKTEQVKEEKTSSKEEKTEAKTEKASEERSTGKSETSAAAKSAIKIVTEAENSAASDTKSSDVKNGFSENTEKSNASGQKSSGSSDNTSATSATEKSTEASNAGSSASGESSTEKATETKTNTSDAETKSSTASSDTNSSTENTSSASNGANGSAAGTGTSTGAGETTAPETNATETSATETTAAVETTAVETIAPETTAELDEEAQKKAESARIRKGILAADTAARKAKLGKTGSWKSSIFDFVKHLFYINVVADAENEADDVEDESISEMEVSEDDIDDYSVDLGKDYTANVVDDEDHVSGKNCFTSIIMARKVSGKWKAQSEFHDGDSVRVSLAVSIPSDAMDEDSRVFYYQLPSAVTISEEQSGLMKRDDIVIGKYVLTEDGMLVVKLTDNISVNQKFRGIIVFDAELSKADDQTMEKIDFGSYVFILHDGASNDSTDGDAEDVDDDVDADETDENGVTDTVDENANKETEAELAGDGELNTRSGLLKVSNRIVTATANYPAETFPIGTKMQVVRVKKPSELKTLKNKVDEQLENENSGKIAKDIYAYDISFIYDGEKIEPLNPVDISLSFNKSQGKPKATKAEDPKKAEWKMFHATEDGEIAEKTDAAEDASEEAEEAGKAESVESSDKNNASATDTSTTEETTSDVSESTVTSTENTTDLVTENSVLHDITEDAEVSTDKDNTVVHKVDFSSDAFSVYVLAYTVDFHYGDYTWSMEGEQSVLLSELFKILGIDKDVNNVENVTFSNTELVSVEKVTDDNVTDWRLVSLQPFDTEELLTISFADGENISVKVTDAQNGYSFTPTNLQYSNDEGEVKNYFNLSSNSTVRDGEYFRIVFDYEVSQGYLSNTRNSISYQIPSEQIAKFINKACPEQSGDIDDNGNKAGTYQISSDGKIKLTFNEEYIEKNKNSEITGTLNYNFGLADLVKEYEKEISIPYADTLKIDDIVYHNYADMEATKTASVDNDKETVTYTITIESANGTFDVVNLSDVMENVLIDNNTNITVKDGNGQNVNVTKTIEPDGKSFNLVLPQMGRDSKYVITYTAHLPAGLDYAVVKATNKATITSKDHDGKEIKKEPSVTVEFKRISVDKRSGSLSSDKKIITWTVIIKNPKGKDLKGFVLRDLYKGNWQGITADELVENVKIEPATGDGTTSIDKNQFTHREQAWSEIDGYTFPENSTAENYTLTYKTYVNGDVSSVHNEATITPPDGNKNNGTSDSADTKINDSNTKEFNVEKKGKGIESGSNGLGISKYHVKVSAKTNYTSNWVIRDDLGDKLWFTKDQLFAVNSSVENAVKESSLSFEFYAFKKIDGYNSDSTPVSLNGLDDDTQYRSFEIRFSNGISKGTSLEFDVNATADLGSVSDSYTFKNYVNVNQTYSDTGENKYDSPKPTVIKTDERTGESGKSEEDIDLLGNVECIDGTIGESGWWNKQSYNNILKWKITISLKDYKDNPLTIVERLPEGVSLKQAGFIVNSDLGWHDTRDDDKGVTYLKLSETNGIDKLFGYEFSYSINDNVITINLPKEVINKAASADYWNRTITLTIYAQLTNVDISDGKSKNGGYRLEKSFNNVVELYKDDEKIDSTSQKQIVYKDKGKNMVSKTHDAYDSTSHTIPYTVILNPERKKLLANGSTNKLTFTDTLSTTYTLSVNGAVSYVLQDVHFYKVNEDESFEDLNLNYDQNSETEIKDKDTRKFTNTFTANIPDKTKIKVTYKYKITSDKSSWLPTISNKAELNGATGTFEKETKVESIEFVASNATAVLHQIKIKKLDSDTLEVIPGTTFTLYKYDSTSTSYDHFTEVKSYVTDKDGCFTTDKLLFNQGYKLVETHPAPGYKDENLTMYFYIESSNTTDNPMNIPDDFSNYSNFKLLHGGDEEVMYNTPAPQYELPATGSRGTTWIYLLGSIILLLGAEWYLLTHKEVSRK